jgi:glycosyltransferase involved in cell wall biosynthesis
MIKNPINNPNKIQGGKRFRGILEEKTYGLPIVSIITAVYNKNSTIEDCIKSVLSQNHVNKEFIVIDGGSTDGTLETLKKYDEIIDYWISEPDNGIYDALNKGIDQAHGDWIYFLGADDRLIDDKVLKDVFSTPPRGKLIYGNVRFCNTGTIYNGPFSRRKLYFNNICQQAVFYHRDLFRNIGNFDLKYPLHADWVFNMKAFSRSDTRPKYVQRTIANYSLSGMSSKNVDHVFFQEHAELIREIFGYPEYLYFKLRHIFNSLTTYVLTRKARR